MKYIRNIILAVSAFTLTSCNDFLEILPLNDVVLEKFWTQKADVTSVLNGCYETLESNDCITRMGVWGEMRSDNITFGRSVGTDINELLKENLLQSNSMCNWKVFYDAINRCNTVCHYAPLVQKRDPNYTETEMKANIAEASAIRALCYFYLIRTFRDVPYTTTPSIDDTKRYVIPATKFDDVLDSLINNLESVKDYAVRRYYTDDNSSAYVNSSRITRWAIYALLADMYLWKGDYDKSIAYCDLILDFKRKQLEEKIARYGNQNNIALFANIPLLLEKPLGSTTCGSAYNSIFGDGNSFESIFELYFSNKLSSKNSFVDKYYGSTEQILGQLSAPDYLYKDVAAGTNTVFKKTDSRAYEGMQLTNSRYAICKYTRSMVSFNTQNISSENDLKLSYTARSTGSSNWIIYRLSDIILIKAEAEIQKGKDYFTDAFTLINIINKRANDVTNTSRSDTLKLSDYADSKQSMEDLLFAERQREFLFEGKRWFDLVRMARRDGNTNRLVSLVSRKYIENANVIKIKLADPNIIYFPYAKSELKVNPYLHQNPAYNRGEDSELTK